MGVEVKCNIEDPIGWMVDYGVWDLISDYSGKHIYDRLDNIYHCLVDGIDPENIEGLEGQTIEELKEEYQREFPKMIAEAFCLIARDIKQGELVIKTEFDL